MVPFLSSEPPPIHTELQEVRAAKSLLWLTEKAKFWAADVAGVCLMALQCRRNFFNMGVAIQQESVVQQGDPSLAAGKRTELLQPALATPHPTFLPYNQNIQKAKNHCDQLPATLTQPSRPFASQEDS